MTSSHPVQSSPVEVFRVALRLGCTSFGGPIAHLGYFRQEYVQNRKWVDDATYADLVALCQFLPGPASSQVGIAIGSLRAGVKGGIAGWIGFTLPSALLMMAFAFAIDRANVFSAGWVDGLKIVAVAIVAQAVWGMGKQFCLDRVRQFIAACALLVCLLVNQSLIQVVVICVAGAIGWRLISLPQPARSETNARSPVAKSIAKICLATFLAVLVLLPITARSSNSGVIAVSDTFYRAGSLVFGGGHAVLPLLERDVIGPGWLTEDEFLAGYGAAQAMPGPLFTFSSFLGTARSDAPNGVAGAALATVVIFLPSFLMIFAAFPWWHALRSNSGFRAALAGVNAAVVGILAAALYSPVWTGAIHAVQDAGIALACLALLMVWKRPSWQVVLFAALAGQASSWLF
jgi:chromate transporter